MVNWFEIDKAGFSEIQKGKPKFYAIRELIQNAFDEPITECNLWTTYERKKVTIQVIDNSLAGFRDLKDAYTLFRSCYKRPFPEKRGYYNKGEKEAIVISDHAMIETMKGTIVFDNKGRHEYPRRKIERGTKVTLKLAMTHEEYLDIMDMVKLIIPPLGIQFYVNNVKVEHRKPIEMKHPAIKEGCYIYESLPTVIYKGDRMTKTMRKTAIRLYEPQAGSYLQPNAGSYLYEMGIPVCKIDCKWSIDVNQRIPMSSDRDTVSPSYLQDLYAIVLNFMHTEVPEDQSSKVWVRQGMSDERIHKEAVQDIIKKRYGDKVVVATPTDPVSIDDAISHGFKVVYGKEMSSEEWDILKTHAPIMSSHEVFGHGTADDRQIISPDENMERVSKLAKYIMREFYSIDIIVGFYTSKKATVQASYERISRLLEFNVTQLGVEFFRTPFSHKVLELLLHELSHEWGMHTEALYHEAMASMAARLIERSISFPVWWTVI